ncbi:MAG TPA: ACT domain-containing protein [Candidatus Norongarragalinales archaeon]|nr:ACT domain-containing protein [Candidatus Norongarragalinales archaeon]
MGKSVAARVWEKLEAQPYLLKAIEGGYANLSEIARKLQREMIGKGEGGSIEAVRAAVKRIAEEKEAATGSAEGKIRKLLKGGKLELSTKISVLVLAAVAYDSLKLHLHDALSVVKSRSGVTIVLPDEHVEELKKRVHSHDILIENKDLVVLSLITSENIEEVPGVVAYLTGKLAENGINLKEFLSSYRDTVMILGKKDSLKAYQLLERLIG